MAHNHVLHYWRSRSRSRAKADSRLLEVVERAYEEAEEGSDEWISWRHALARCMKRLPEKLLDMLGKRCHKGFASAEIGDVDKVEGNGGFLKGLIDDIRV